MLRYLTAAQRLRTSLRAAGFTAQQVTVRNHRNTLLLTIRDQSVVRGTVEAIAASGGRAVAGLSYLGEGDAPRARHHRRVGLLCGTTITDEGDDRDLGGPAERDVVGIRPKCRARAG